MVERSRRQRWFNSGIASQADAESTACVMRAAPRDGNLSLVPLSKQKSSAGPAPSAAKTE
jgi:hypothetical protein